ncbi:hypothetical protein [Aliikangiella maris]|uniref:Uncharacterized protein n=2 Tax=Aliikangiella maris TaxID=3162458 RepID=A0ABV3MUV7_9GAMM
MATSSIRYGSNDVFVKDHEIGDWIKAMTDQFDHLISSGKDVEWLLVECNRWCEIYENYPPGLKDIEFDDVLAVDSENRIDEIVGVLNSVLKQTTSNGYELEIAKNISSKILSDLFNK